MAVSSLTVNSDCALMSGASKVVLVACGNNLLLFTEWRWANAHAIGHQRCGFTQRACRQPRATLPLRDRRAATATNVHCHLGSMGVNTSLDSSFLRARCTACSTASNDGTTSHSVPPAKVSAIATACRTLRHSLVLACCADVGDDSETAHDDSSHIRAVGNSERRLEADRGRVATRHP